MEAAIQNANIVANIFSDHSAITLSMSLESDETKRGPGFWKFNTLLLMDKKYFGWDHCVREGLHSKIKIK